MERIEDIIRRIALMISTLGEEDALGVAHDAFVPASCSEGDFFLVWHAGKMYFEDRLSA